MLRPANKTYLKIGFSNFTTGSTILPCSSTAFDMLRVDSIDTINSQIDESTRWSPGHSLLICQYLNRRQSDERAGSPPTKAEDIILGIPLPFHFWTNFLHESLRAKSFRVGEEGFVAQHSPISQRQEAKHQNRGSRTRERESLETNQIFPKIKVPLGINIPLYMSSSIRRCGRPDLRAPLLQYRIT